MQKLKLSLAVAIATALLAGAIVAWAGPKLSTFLPGSNVIDSWVVYQAADRGAYTEKGLYDLYDGDVPHLKQFGLQAAHQRVYKHGSQRVIIDLMQLDNYQHAKALYRERTKGLSSIPGYKQLVGLKEQGVLVPTGGVSMVYFWQRNYLCSVSAYGTSSAQQQTAARFARWIANKIQRYYAPKKSR